MPYLAIAFLIGIGVVVGVSIGHARQRDREQQKQRWAEALRRFVDVADELAEYGEDASDKRAELLPHLHDCVTDLSAYPQWRNAAGPFLIACVNGFETAIAQGRPYATYGVYGGDNPSPGNPTTGLVWKGESEWSYFAWASWWIGEAYREFLYPHLYASDHVLRILTPEAEKYLRNAEAAFLPIVGYASPTAKRKAQRSSPPLG